MPVLAPVMITVFPLMVALLGHRPPDKWVLSKIQEDLSSSLGVLYYLKNFMMTAFDLLLSEMSMDI